MAFDRIPAVPLALALTTALSFPVARSHAQQTTTAAIADSPTAQTLFGDVRAQAEANPAESARLARRLLDEYGGRMIKVGAETDDLFTSVSAEVERFLLGHPEILARFRDMETRGAERMLAEEGPSVTAARRRLTAPGLSATIELAERAVRGDQPLEAISLLSRVRGHPDLSAERAVAHAVLESMALRRIGDATGSDAALARAASIEGVDRGAVESAMAAARRTSKGSGGVLGRSPLVTAPDGGDPDSTWREIWALDLDQSLFRRVYGGPAAGRTAKDVESVRSNARLMVAIPTVLGNRVLLSEGHRVRSVDIDSRDEIWSREIGSVGVGRESAPIGDLSAVTADSGIAVVYEGHAAANERTASPRVWALDPATGAVKWNTVVDGCDGRAELAGLFPTGAPLLVSDLVVVATRKPTQRLEQVDWLLALDRADGQLRWALSIAGAPVTRFSTGRQHSGLATDGAVVIDTTPLGAVACIRASDGAVEWLRRFPVPLRDPRSLAEPWEVAAPAISGDRVIAISPDESEIVALDRSSGRLLDARPLGPDTQWATPLYLISATSSDATPIVLGVGSDVVAFDARDLSKRLWSLSESTRDIIPPRSGTAIRNGIRGRVSVAGQYVVVPGVQEILLLDLSSGRVNARVPMAAPGNPLLLGDRIVSAGDDALRVIMPSERAEAMLRARLAAMPDDPSAAVALLELAQATGRPLVALDAARTAERALSRGRGSEQLRQELMGKLVALAAANPELGDDAFAIVSGVSNTPLLRVRGEMARGEFLRTAGRATDAVRCWQRLAGDILFTTQLVGDDSAKRQVRIEAMARIAQLGSRDRDIAAALESEAEAARGRLPAAPSRALLADLVHEHPRTQASIQAIASASLPADEAIGLALAAVSDCLVPPARVELIDTLRAFIAERLDPASRAGTMSAIDQRIAAMLAASGVDRPDLRQPVRSLPAVGVAAVAGIDLRSKLVRQTIDCSRRRDPDLILGLLEGALVRLAGPELAVQWRLRLEDRDPLLIHAGERIVLWQSLPPSDGSAHIIDASQGTLLYASPRSSELWPVAGRQPEPTDGFGNELGRPGRSQLSPLVVPVCDGESLVLVRRNGDLARIGVMDQKFTPTLARGVLELVYCEDIRDGLLTIGGRATSPEGPRAVVLVLDARTLAPRVRIEPESSADIRWAFATALGEVFIGTSAGIERWTIGPAGDPLPTLVSLASESAQSDRPELLGANILTIDVNERPTLLPVFTGNPRAVPFPDGAEARQIRDLVPLGGSLLLQSDDRFVLLGPSGEVVGMDANSRDANFAFALPVSGGLLQVTALPVEADQAKLRRDVGVVVERLSIAKGLRNEGGAYEVRVRDSRVNLAMVANGWLLLSNMQGTVAVSLPLGGAKSQAESPPGTP